MTPEKPNNIRQVQLPSGKVIEVVYFAEAPVGGPHPESPAKVEPVPTTSPRTDLHICPRCASELVYPVDWAESGSSHWEVELRCPSCEWLETGVFPQDVVERFDIELDRGAEALLRDLQHLAHANMAEEIERFVRALDADQILPIDF